MYGDKFSMQHMWALTLVVLILFPDEHIHPELSGRVLHSSPSRQGSISHHHFPITMDAAEGENRPIENYVSLLQRYIHMYNALQICSYILNMSIFS